MQLEINEQRENQLLSRTEVSGKLSFEQSTPSKEEVKKSIASKLKAKEQLIVIKNIGTKFGARTASLSAYVYKDEDSFKRIEPPLGKKAAEKVAKQEAKKESEAPAEQPAAAPKEESKPKEAKETAAPIEEKKEEPAKEAAEEKKE
jgi:ribosomal protein S24E